LEPFRGRELDTAGDGLYAGFEGSARAIRRAVAIRGDARSIGLEVRAGVHTGECEVIGEEMGGIAVHIGARVAATAGSGEVLVSSTVKDLVVGSRIEFEDRGASLLEGHSGGVAIVRSERAGRRLELSGRYLKTGPTLLAGVPAALESLPVVS